MHFTRQCALSNLASFTVTNLTIAAAVPEPSTCAAIFGAIALMGTIAVRRRLKQA
uniref:PEP-CTERM sorting domain-containing protein n=1 Tax=Cephaloticoccus sp. TaxID=1985742 RepID=UPI004048EEDD